MFEITDTQKIGVGLTGFGMIFLFLGMLMLFDKGLLAIGNILFLSGLGFVIGPERAYRFFFQRQKLRGTAAFFGGIVIVLVGWPLVGMLIEVYGFVVLFSGFLPVAINFLRRVPVIGWLLNMPVIGGLMDRLAGDANRTTVAFIGVPKSAHVIYNGVIDNFLIGWGVVIWEHAIQTPEKKFKFMFRGG